MSSTKRARLTDIIQVAYRGTTNIEVVGVKEQERSVAISADTSTSDPTIFHAIGSACAILDIYFVPDIAIASSATEKVVVNIFNTGAVDGSGTTSLGTYSTYASDSSTINAALVAYVPKKIYDPTGDELVVAQNTVIRADVDVTTSSSISLTGKFVVRYVPLID